MSNLLELSSLIILVSLFLIVIYSKVTEPYLDTKRACHCVESVLERLAGRQLTVTKSWQTFHTEVVEHREVIVQLERTMTESVRVSLILLFIYFKKINSKYKRKLRVKLLTIFLPAMHKRPAILQQCFSGGLGVNIIHFLQ